MPGSEAAATVVVAENDASMTRALRRILRLAGYEVVIYASAEALLDAGGAGNAACLVLDVHLPGMDGFALHRALLARGTVPPVIFMTGFDDAAQDAPRPVDGATRLAKPFHGRALLAAIHGLVDGAASSRRFEA